MTACSPVERTVIRLNADGSVDFALCTRASRITNLELVASPRNDQGRIDEDAEVSIHSDETELAVGQVVHFDGLPDEWDRLDFYVEPGRTSAWRASVEADQLTLGEWHWGDGAPLTDYVPKERCELIGSRASG